LLAHHSLTDDDAAECTLVLGAGIFATNPVSGYPPGTPEAIQYSWHGALHYLFTLPGFVALAAACFVFCRRSPCGASVDRQSTRRLALSSSRSRSSLPARVFGQAAGLVDLARLF
jgi:hypothetical protein